MKNPVTNPATNPVVNLIKYFQKEPGHALTFGYLMLIAIGLIFDFSYYDALKINVIQFVELDDLLLAPIQDVWILLTVFGFCLLLYCLIEWDVWWRKMSPESYLKWNTWSGNKDPFSEKATRRRSFLFPLLFIFYVFLGANTYGVLKAKRVKKGQVAKVQLTIKDVPTDSLTHKNNPVFFVGKTKSFVFVYDTATKTTSIINIGEIQKIEFEK